MPRTLNKLTYKAAESAKFEGKPRKLFDGGGLYLHITHAGKYWRLKYRHGGAERLMALGVFPDVSLAAARAARDDARAKLSNGIDPSAQRRAEREAGGESFEAVAREWLEKERTKLGEETLRLARRRIETWALPMIGKRPIREIEPAEVLRMLRRIEAKGKHETAHRVRQRVGQICRYAIVTGRADRDPTADLKGVLATVPSKSRAAVTAPADVAALMRAIHQYDGQPATCAALKLLPLVFVRPGELRKATWDEFDLQNAIWRIPANRMKMNRDHIVPLAPQAVAELRELEPITGHQSLVFEGLRRGRPLSENTLNVALRTLGYSGDRMSAHGFRALASTLLHENGWQPEVIELQLAHSQRNQVAAAYNRSARLEERREMMAWWSDYLDSLSRD